MSQQTYADRVNSRENTTPTATSEATPPANPAATQETAPSKNPAAIPTFSQVLVGTTKCQSPIPSLMHFCFSFVSDDSKAVLLPSHSILYVCVCVYVYVCVWLVGS